MKSLPTLRLIFAGCALVLSLQPCAAQDAAAGRARAAAQCAVCHGLDGLSKHPEAPNLAGQVEFYLVKALEDFRSGARRNEMMSLVSKDLSDGDIAALAAYYSAIPITVSPPAPAP
ncbi:c-type cytochrome [Ancylobacter lacus]|uniref:c-type cytochrome n=1 Tax=Ancylobacter lacus TaxID=2579970 RepID=UPI001BCDFB76|nr:c-type cytochrome [Ancylobacter lacus]MBS7539330.1 c-type cytochrome [Ancylobacter lacus]